MKYEMGDEATVVSEMADKNTRRAVKAQQQIGLRYMCRGFLAREWMVAMKENGVERVDQKMMALQDIIWFVILKALGAQGMKYYTNRRTFMDGNRRLG